MLVLQVLVDAKSFDAAVADFNAALALAPAGMAAARLCSTASSVTVAQRAGREHGERAAADAAPA